MIIKKGSSLEFVGKRKREDLRTRRPLWIVEGMNRKINLTLKKSFGFRTIKIARTCLYHQLGELPEPEFTHKFWRRGYFPLFFSIANTNHTLLSAVILFDFGQHGIIEPGRIAPTTP